MDIFSPLVRHFFFPLWMNRDGYAGIYKHLNRFNALDELSREQLLERQFIRLKELLKHAYQNTSYYRKTFDDAGFEPSKMIDSDEIRKLPLLTKEIVRGHFDGLTAQNILIQDRLQANTGGSTGVPMVFLRDRNSMYLRKGQEYYFDRWMGYQVGEKIALFVAASHFDGRVDKLKTKIRNATCERMLRFDPHNITDQYLDEFLPQYIKFHAPFIKCFPNALTSFAHYIKRQGIQLPPARTISCTGENLYKHQREMFEDVFGGEVFEKVGTRESGVFACECHLHKGMHVFTEGVFLEIIRKDGKPAGPGEIGKVVLTDLFNQAMPLVRYDIGDMAVASGDRRCECGSELPMIEKLLGRDRDIILDSSGNPKPGYLFTEIIMHMNLKAQFQVLQPDRDNLIVKIVNKDAEHVDIKKIEADFQAIVGQGVRISFENVQEIPRDPSGKYGYVVSKLKY